MIFLGTVIKSKHWDKKTEARNIRFGKSSTVYIKVDSVIKGDISIGEEIFIYQTESSCSAEYRFGSQQLIFGNKINEIIGLIPEKTEEVNSPIFTDIGHIVKDTIKTHNNNKLFPFLKRIIQTHTVINTNMCRSFDFNSSSYNDVRDLLAKKE